MKRIMMGGIVGMAMLAASTWASAGWQPPAARTQATQASAVCAGFAGTVSGNYPLVAFATGGSAGAPLPGETYTVTITGGNGSFSIVGDGNGATTYAGPVAMPGTLTWTATAGNINPAALGVGFYVNSVAPGQDATLTVTASCTAGAAVASVPVPVDARWALALLGLLLAAAGAVVVRRRHA